jgi:Cu+-exporting ATPase
MLGDFDGATAQQVDPVCGMLVDPNTAPATSEYNGQTYYFCSFGCKRDFDTDPEKYLSAGGQAQNPRMG